MRKCIRARYGANANAVANGEPVMSTAPELRRTDRAMSENEIESFLREGHHGRLATIGADGYPYCLPLLYVFLEGRIYVHGAAVQGHLRANVEHSAKACFEVDEAGDVFAYGRFECDTSIAYRSAIAFGQIGLVLDGLRKKNFFDAFMAKYANSGWERPKGFYPRMDKITVYALAIERLTGKKIALPEVAQQWPAKDRSMSPGAKPPAR